MPLLARSLCLCVVVLLAAGGLAFSADGQDAKPPAVGETAAEKLRKALDRVRDLEIADQALDTAVNQLREQTGINFVIDRATLAISPLLPGMGISPIMPASYAHLRIGGPFHDMPVRVALTKMLSRHDLSHVIIGDTVLISTAEKAIERQLGQLITVSIEAKPLRDVLKRLARETGANVVLDPRATKEGATALTLRLDEVPLETAVELLADEAGLKAVRMSNVLYVTSEARAEKLRKPRPLTAAVPAGSWQVWADGNGSFRLTPPAGVGIGGGGIGGGLGGFGGMAGLGGGGFNQLGTGGGFAGMGGLAKPVPLTPPLPKANQPAPDKPKPEKPAVKPPSKDKSAPKDKPAPQALRPNTPAPRSRQSDRSNKA